MRLRDRKLDALVLADRAAEDDALGRVGGRLLDEPAPVADALRGDQDPLRVHPVEDVAEALPLLADECVGRYLDAVEEDLGRRVVHQRLDRPDRHRPGRECLLHVDDEGREPLRLLRHLVERRRPREQEHQVGVQRARGPDLLPADQIAAVVTRGRRLQARRVGAGPGLRDAERLQPQLARSDLRQVLLLLLVGAVPEDRAHRVHLRVAGARVAAARVDLLEDHARRR